MADSKVPIDYTSRDFAAIRDDLVAAIPEYLPEWTNRTESDFGIVLIELFAYMGDIQGYYIDRIANEAFITTAVQRASVLSLARMLDYRPSGLSAATVELTFTTSPDAPGITTIPAGTRVSTLAEGSVEPVVFETNEEILVAVDATGTVMATEGETKTEDEGSPVGVSDGSADQVFPLYYENIIEGTLNVFVDEDGAGPGTAALWRYTSHLIDASSEDRVYSTVTDENGITYISFGDNVNGRIPTQGAVITAEYRVGQGSRGNVGSGTLVELSSPIIGVESVTNIANATGGADAESINSIRRNAPRSLTTLERAVTTKDYEVLAQKVSGVLHTKAVAEVYTNVTLYVAPTGGGVATSTLKNAILNDLADKKMINTSVVVEDPTYVPINITVAPLNVLPQYNRQAVELAVENALSTLLEVENVGFAYRVTLSQVYQAIQNVDGVDYAVVTELNSTGTGLSDVVMADNEIPSVGTITVTATGGLIGS